MKLKIQKKGSQDKPVEDCLIYKCGELKEGEDDGTSQIIDETGDKYHNYPADSGITKAEDRLKASQEIRKIGNDLFVKKEFEKALLKYQKALRYLKSDEKENLILDRESIIVMGNICSVKIHTKSFREVIDISNQILEKDPKNLKALQRKATTHMELFEFDLASKILKQCLEIENSNKINKFLFFFTLFS